MSGNLKGESPFLKQIRKVCGKENNTSEYGADTVQQRQNHEVQMVLPATRHLKQDRWDLMQENNFSD